MKKYLLVFGLITLAAMLRAQTVPAGAQVFDDLLRRQQLEGKLDSTHSLTNRPFQLTPKLSKTFYAGDTTKSGITFLNGKGHFELLPLVWKNQYNTKHPFGWNDGLMIPARGLQTFVTAGFFAQFGPLSIQFQPEYVFAENKDFDGFRVGKTTADLDRYYRFYNFIDAPERFGRNSYQKFSLGQSSIKLNVGPLFATLSNENVWWGPGVMNSLSFTNNAPGFEHVALGTSKPIKTPIGSFEASMLGGRLLNSEEPPLPQQNGAPDSFYVPSNDIWRYLFGFNFSYQPKWLPGLFLGFSRTFVAYHDALRGIGDYVPLFTKLQKSSGDQDVFDRDQRISLYGRWLMQKAKAEVYFEYGINDNAYNFRDFLGSPDHSRSYLVGLNKLIPINGKPDQYVQINLEALQLSQSTDRVVRSAGGFYQHGAVRQGYTHFGQTLGAGTGTGGNLQTMALNWVHNFKKIGFRIDRFEHDMDFYDTYVGDYNGLSRKWVDYALALQGQIDYKKFIFSAKAQGIQSLNYQWLMKDFTPDQYYIPQNDVFNFHGELGVIYRF